MTTCRICSLSVSPCRVGLYFWRCHFGIIGFAAYRYGKKAQRNTTKWLGVALMLYPYAISQTWLLYVAGAALCAGCFSIVAEGPKSISVGPALRNRH